MTYSVCVFEHLVEGDRLAELIALARERGVDGVRLLLPMPSGRWLGSDDVVLSPEVRQAVSRHVDGRFVEVAEAMDTPDFEGCGGVSSGTIFVSPYGDVQPCNFTPVALGNVREEPLDLIVERARRHRFFAPEFQAGRCLMQSPDFLAAVGPGLDPETQLYELEDFDAIATHAGCNNGCADCPSRAAREGAPLAEQLDALLERAPLAYRDVWIRGGEPFLDPEVLEAIERIAARGLQPCLLSNGRMFAYRTLAADAARAGLAEVHIPVWGGSAAEYEAHVRVPGAFGHLVKGVGNLRAAAVPVIVYVDPTEADESLVERLRSAGADRIVRATLPPTFFCDAERPLGRMALPDARIEVPPRRRRRPRGFAIVDRRTGPGALVVVPPQNLSALATRDFPLDTVTNFPLAALKLARLYRRRGYEVGFLDAFNDSRAPRDPTADPRRLLRHAPCGNFDREGIERPIYRVGLTRDALAARFAEMPDAVDEVLVSSVYTYSWQSTWEVIELARERYPRANIRLGGIYPTLCHEHATGSGADEVVCGPDPEVARQWIDLDTWRRVGRGRMSLKSTLGCNYACSYCAVAQLEGRCVSPAADDFMLQLDQYARHGLKELHFWDSNILHDRAHFIRILEYFAGLERVIPLAVPSGFALLGYDLELARLMRRAGFVNVVVPLETTRDDKLREFGRRGLSRRFQEAVEVSREAGFAPHQIQAVIMIGYPGQTREDVLADLAAIVAHGVRIDLRVYTPIPGTRDYENYTSMIDGRALEDFDSFLFPMASPDLEARFLEDVYLTFNRQRLTTGDLRARRGAHYLYDLVARML